MRHETGPGQESVWDYPRPPRIETCTRRARVLLDGETLADTDKALRVLETSHPPTYYIPTRDVRMERLKPCRGRSLCEFKGEARYWSLSSGGRSAQALAWDYPDPWPGYEALKDHLAFYPSRVDACFVGDERVRAQAGDFYGGWITANIVGPFKGGPGTMGW